MFMFSTPQNQNGTPNDIFIPKPNTGPSERSKAFTQAIHEIVVMSSIGTWMMLKSIFTRYCPLTIAILSGVVWSGHHISTEALHIKFIHNLEPTIFTYDRLMMMYKLHRNVYWAMVSSMLYLVVAIIAGIFARSIRTKYMKIFHLMGLKNGAGDTPKLIMKKKIDSDRSKLIFDANGIGLSEFQAKKERLEAHFKQNVESISYGHNKGRIEISFNKKEFPELIKYKELLVKNPLPANSFFVGHSTDGVISQSVAKLPHMLIAGVTDSGKSVFFKQVLMGLLESTPNVQMYLIDLKGGLEMVDFVSAPNVRFVKTIDGAVTLLQQIESEMKSRFDYLEKNGRKVIEPEVDKKDRIIVGVDEASILYTTPMAGDPNKDKILEARKLTDSIAKLSRAASIHLLLATQKVEAQIIPTSVTENITGRMMFRSNSFQGSNQMLGSKDAMDLPKIPGRGIWSCGTTKELIQSPFINEDSIVSRCNVIAEDFKSGARKCFNEMIGDKQQEEAKKKQEKAQKTKKKATQEELNQLNDKNKDDE
jgi:S-DNA-T family DNA segregation ATPase FtsK/SpoIIIE